MAVFPLCAWVKTHCWACAVENNWGLEEGWELTSLFSVNLEKVFTDKDTCSETLSNLKYTRGGDPGIQILVNLAPKPVFLPLRGG